jgi:hypothetical protein
VSGARRLKALASTGLMRQAFSTAARSIGSTLETAGNCTGVSLSFRAGLTQLIHSGAFAREPASGVLTRQRKTA